MGNWFDLFFKGFKFWTGGFWGKIIYFFILFVGFNFVVNTLFPKLKRETSIQTVQTYVEAADNQKVAFAGVKLWRVGIGFYYE